MSVSIPCPIARYAAVHPDHDAILTPNQTWTYRGLHAAITRQTRALTTTGIRAGDRVALTGLPPAETIIRLFALWRSGAWAALINDRLPVARREEILSQLDGRTMPAENTPPSDEPTGREPARGTVGIPAAEAAVMLSTSGSTQGPKIVVLSFANLYHNARGANAHLPIRPGDRWMLSLPLYHVSGLGILLRTFLAGGTVAVPDPSTGLADNLARHHITHVSLVPTQLFRLLKQEGSTGRELLRGLKAILLGGGPIPARLLHDGLQNRLPIYVSYGLTEMGSQVATSAPLRGPAPARMTARVLPGRELRISDDRELQVKGPCLFQGYWHQGRLTRPLTPDGWFATGDLGEWTGDGGLIVYGRRDLMFVAAGENICPEEIERALLDIPGVEQAVVVPMDDPEYGQVPVAFLSAPELRGLTTTALRVRLKAGLPGIKIPREFYHLPPSEPGALKTRRAALRQALDQPGRPGCRSLPS